MKATMLAAGGLSGGLSSSIVGGKFIDGVRQGLITSGLNHLAHSVANRIAFDNYIDGKLDAAGYNRSDIIGMNSQELDNFARKVFPEMYAAGGSPEFLLNDTIDGYGLTLGICDACALFNKRIQINIHSRAFTDNFKLAAVVGHELVHASDYFSGRMTSRTLQFDDNYAAHQSEVKAYNWNINNNSLFSNYETYKNHINKLGWSPLNLTEYGGPK